VSNKKNIRVRSRPRVALLIETSRAYGRDLLVGIAQYVRAHGPWDIEFQEGDPTEKLPQWFKTWKGDGIIARVKTRLIANEIRKLKIPAVDLYCGLSDLKMASMRSDEKAVGKIAAQHLLEKGFRQFAFCGFNGTEWSDRRRAGFQESIAEANLPCYVYDNPRPQSVLALIEYEEHGSKYEQQLGQWLKSLPKATGLMACNDMRARQVLSSCRDLQLLVPDDIAVIGVDKDEIFCELANMPLSSVILNTGRIGYEAAGMLDRMMLGEKISEQTVLIEPSGVAARQSTDVLAVEDPNLVKALRLIRDHACDRIDIDQVAAGAGLSRSVLQRKFRNLLGKSVHEEIINARLKRACELLAGTELNQFDIAEKSGFRYPEYMGVVFKARLHKTPSQYRKELNLKQLGRLR
jgi:LacI family transcriptional regulator